jgi:putative ABC transport system substrate-binding protein
MRRRELILGAGATFALPVMVRALSASMPVIGFLSSASADAWASYLAGFRRGLKETGYVEGLNLAIEYRWAEGDYSMLAALASDLAGRRLAVIVTGGGPVPALAAKAATGTIPIVFAMGGDPVERGLIASLARPGGQITGVNFLTAQLNAKRLNLLHDLVPKAKRVGVLLNNKNPSLGPQTRDIEAAAPALGLQIKILHAATARELDAVLTKSQLGDAKALLTAADPYFAVERDRIVALVSRLALPAIYEEREFADTGGLMSYGADVGDSYREVGVYVGRILKGEKPDDLPIVQPTKFELVINLKTAKALGLTVPQVLLAQADEVIE